MGGFTMIGVKYFKDKRVQVYAYLSDGSQDNYIEKGLIPISEAEATEISNPPPTHDELVSRANAKKNVLLDEANAITTDWCTELALGIISDVDKAKLIAWIEYIKAVKAVDTTTAPNIIWPAPHET
ncbi:tail fiber assembly protein [Salmonella enterica subsp. arizonae]|nr:tail fiber assembly protein [Salmonella enterica subsp. arizonae]EHX7635468.1 tail fiber assembly protein [Salmonella enterica]